MAELLEPPIPVDCLTDCNRACCLRLANPVIEYNFDLDEAKHLVQLGTKLSPHGEGYAMTGECGALDGNRCTLHGTGHQPQCCQDNLVGGPLCLAVRKSYSGRKFAKPPETGSEE